MSVSNSPSDKVKIAIIGLGYVGLPLAVEFAKKYEVIGFDINPTRIQELSKGHDRTLEVKDEILKSVLKQKRVKVYEKFIEHQGENSTLEVNSNTGLTFSSEIKDIETANIYIVTVPTPIDRFKRPDLTPLYRASETVGKVLKPGDIVIYESTVYPGCTEEECIPVLEKFSGLQFNIDFYAGYSPERINPGDKVNTLTKIVKVTSGSTPDIADRIDALYKSIITAGTHKAPSIKVAEASKAIENAQRDLNISFVNELALIFDRIGIDTNDVIEAAGTKWNFLKYRPGLVGGHCIGVDPYYLAHKAQEVGYHPQVILSGRRVNDKMGAFVADKVVKLMIKKDHKIKGARALIMGITFKENCPDIRNTRVVDIYHELNAFGLKVDVYDPWANVDEVREEYGLEIKTIINGDVIYDAIVVAVSHEQFKNFDFERVRHNNGVIFDTKGCLQRSLVDARL